MDHNHQSQLLRDSIEGIITRCVPQVMDHLLPKLDEMTYITINRAAGMLEMNSGACKRFLAGYIVDFGLRNQRVSLANLKIAIEARRVKMEKARRKATDPRDSNQLGLSL